MTYHPDDAATTKSSKADRELLSTLVQKNHRLLPSHQLGIAFQNDTVAMLARETYTVQDLDTLTTLLEGKGVFTIPVIRGHTVTIDASQYPVSVVAATEIKDSYHGEMSSMIYLRDHIQTASAYMELALHDPDRYKIEGKVARELLLSALHLLSTPSQLARFDNVIKKGNSATQEDWPHISLYLDNLTATKPNGWRNKQDTFQMLAYLTLDAIERNFLSSDDLLPSHKRFLGLIVPLLTSVDFPDYESSGSWEEIATKRSSVIAIETALLNKIRILFSTSKECDFLRGYSNRAGFLRTVDALIKKGLTTLGQQLPNESPNYNQDSIKFRAADATLAYVLLYDLPAMLAHWATPITSESVIMTEQQIETLILDQLATLNDTATSGIMRYKDDSYQRSNFHTNTVQATIKTIKRYVAATAHIQKGEIDLDTKQQLRHQHTPHGRAAAWTHPLGQLASWAALKSMQAPDASNRERYIAISTHFFNRTLAAITGDHCWNATLNIDGQYEAHRVAAFALPECYITYTIGQVQLIVPSPHTPLNWSSAMAKQAAGLLRVSIANAPTSLR